MVQYNESKLKNYCTTEHPANKRATFATPSFNLLDINQKQYWPTVQLAVLRLANQTVAMRPDQRGVILGLLIIILSCAAILIATLIL